MKNNERRYTKIILAFYTHRVYNVVRFSGGIMLGRSAWPMNNPELYSSTCLTPEEDFIFYPPSSGKLFPQFPNHMETCKAIPPFAYGRILLPQQINPKVINAMIPFCEETMINAANPNRTVHWFGTTRIEREYKYGRLILERRIENSKPEEFCGTTAGVELYSYTNDGQARKEETYTPRPDGTWQMIYRGLIFGEQTENGLVWKDDLYLDDNV